MKIERNVKLSIRDILKLNNGITEISHMLFNAEYMMDLGLIKSKIDIIMESYQDVLQSKREELWEKHGIKIGDEIEPSLQAILKHDIEKVIESLDEKEYELDHPVFSRSELKSWMKDAENSKSERAFKPSVNFFANMVDFIEE